MRRFGRFWWAALLLASACGSDAGAEVVLDWTDPVPVEVEAGLVVGPCSGGGEAPIVCVSRDGIDLALIEHGSAPLSSFPEVPAGTGSGAALDIISAGYLDSFGADRAAGCPGWQFTATGPAAVPVAGSEGRAVGFALERDGRRTEQSESGFVIVGDTVHWLTINLWDPAAACLPDTERPTAPPQDWERLLGLFGRIAAGSRF